MLTIPLFSLRLGTGDQGNDPKASTTRKAYDLLADGFGPGFNGPLQLVAKVNSPEDAQALDRSGREGAGHAGRQGRVRGPDAARRDGRRRPGRPDHVAGGREDDAS